MFLFMGRVFSDVCASDCLVVLLHHPFLIVLQSNSNSSLSVLMPATQWTVLCCCKTIIGFCKSIGSG